MIGFIRLHERRRDSEGGTSIHDLWVNVAGIVTVEDAVGGPGARVMTAARWVFFVAEDVDEVLELVRTATLA